MRRNRSTARRAIRLALDYNRFRISKQISNVHLNTPSRFIIEHLPAVSELYVRLTILFAEERFSHIYNGNLYIHLIR